MISVKFAKHIVEIHWSEIMLRLQNHDGLVHLLVRDQLITVLFSK